MEESVMGLFDRVLFGCKNCGTLIEVQSKADECWMRTYALNEAPPTIAMDLDGKMYQCPKCGAPHQFHAVHRPVLTVRFA